MRTMTAMIVLAGAGLVLGCEAPTATDTDGADAAAPLYLLGEDGRDNARIQQGLSELRRWSARFHDLDEAMDHGYTVNVGCVSDPVLGGMGFHFTRGDVDLIGDGEVGLLEPEFLVYMTDRSGKMRFGGFDYFVPFATWDVEARGGPPSLLGIEFHPVEVFQAWVLHIWLWWHNPAGMFEDFNSTVPLCD